MKSADCPFRAPAGVRARMPLPLPPLPLIRVGDLPRVVSLLAIGVGFACGCWLGSRWTPCDAWWAIVSSGVKYLPLVAAAAVLRRWRGRGHRYGDCGGRTWSMRTVRGRKPYRS